jgi:glycogen synthase
MGTADLRTELEAYILVLKGRLNDQVSPDAMVTALAAIVQAQALLLMSDTLHSTAQTLVHDGLRPLMSRLPDR